MAIDKPIPNPQDSILNAFDEMASSLREALIELENRVESRTRDLEIAGEVARQAATVLDLDALLPHVAELTKNSFGLYHAHIYLLDEAGENLVLTAGAGEIGQRMVAEGRIIPVNHERSIVAQSARTRAGVVVNNVTEDPNFLPHPLLPDTRAEMAIPMIFGDQVMGVLDVQASETGWFTENDVLVKSALAAQIAVAVQNARAFAQSEAAQKELARIFDSSIDLIGSANFSGYFTRLNPAWEQTLGWTSQELMAEPFVSFVHPDDVDATNAEAAKIAQGITTLLFENRYRCKDGSYKWISWRATPDIENSLIHFVARDVTEARHAEEQIRLFADVVNNSPIGKYVWQLEDPDDMKSFRLLAANPASAQATGIQPDAIVGKKMIETFAGLFDTPVPGIYFNVVKSQQAVELGEIRYGDENIEESVFYVRAFPLPNNCVGVSFENITARKQQEKALAESEARFRDIAHTMPGAIFQFTAKDGVWSVPFMSAGVEAIVGVSAEAIMQDLGSFTARIHPDDLNDYLASVSRVVESLEPWDYTGRIIKPTGEIVWWHGLSQPSRNADGDLVFNGMLFDITASKNAEATLAANQAQLAEAVSVARLGHWELDIDRRMFIFNDQFYNLLHTTVEQEGGYEMPIEEYATRFLPAAYVPMVAEGTAAALSTTDPNYSNELEHPIVRADGSEGHFLVRIRIQKDDTGRTVKVYGANQDITEQKQIEQERQILFETANALNNAQTPVEMLDAARQYACEKGAVSALLLYIDSDEANSPIWAEVVGEWQSSGHSIFQGARFYLPEFPFSKLWMSNPDRPILVDDVETSALMDETTRAVYRQAGNRSSVTIPLHVQNRWVGLLTFSWNEPQRFTEQDERIYTSITQQATPAVDAVRSAQMTRKRALELETVAHVSAAISTNLAIDSLLTDVVNLTKDSFSLYHAHIYLLDPAGENLVLAAGAGEIGQQMVAEGRIIPVDRQDSIVAAAFRTLDGVIVNDVTQNPNFLPHPLLPNTRSEMAVPMVIGTEAIGVLDVQADVVNFFSAEELQVQSTLAAQIAVAIQNARAFEKSREADRLKSEFLANMSHELRTPLNSIIGYAEVLLEGIDGELTDDMNEDVRAIHGSGQHLLNIINDILDLAKIEAGKMTIDRQPVDLTQFVREITRAGQILVKNKPVELHLVESRELPQVFADSVRLRQIVWNLLSNAVKFTEAGSVTVTTGMQDENHVFVEVRDTGIGIRKEDLPRIFEQFRQVDGSSTRRAGGTGLGLNITRHLINMHEGEILVDSEFGMGSTFRFTLPIFTEERVTN